MNVRLPRDKGSPMTVLVTAVLTITSIEAG